MKKRTAPWLLIGIPLVALAAFHAVGLVLSLIGLGAVYWQSIRRHPRTRHTGWFTCKGTGEIRSKAFPWVFYKCRSLHCNGGRVIRFGARHFGPGYIQNEDAALVAKKKLAKQNRVSR